MHQLELRRRRALMENQYAVKVRRTDGGTTTIYVKAKSREEAWEIANQDQEVERPLAVRKL